MDRQTQSLLCQIGHGVRPSEDAVADALPVVVVELDTEVGRGSTFRLTLPATTLRMRAARV